MKYFHITEFNCRCGCGENKMDPTFLKKLDALREELQFPLILSSAYRCRKHNRAVSTTGDFGPHTTGHAADVKVDRLQAYKLLALAPKHGFTGIGIKQKGGGRFIHLDDLEQDIGQPRPTVWSY
jgi:zinc D-Ala-D-Ala carboxypeptidase